MGRRRTVCWPVHSCPGLATSNTSLWIVEGLKVLPHCQVSPGHPDNQGGKEAQGFQEPGAGAGQEQQEAQGEEGGAGGGDQGIQGGGGEKEAKEVHAAVLDVDG